MKPTTKRLLIGCGSVSLLGLVGIVLLGIWAFNSPEGGVKLGNEMDQYALDYIAEYQLLDPGEEVLAYYDVTVSMNGTEAALLTTDRVLYHKRGHTTAIRFADIDDVTHRNESMIGDIFEIRDTSGRVMKVEIAPYNQGETFKNVLMNLWEEHRGAAGAP